MKDPTQSNIGFQMHSVKNKRTVMTATFQCLIHLQKINLSLYEWLVEISKSLDIQNLIVLQNNQEHQDQISLNSKQTKLKFMRKDLLIIITINVRRTLQLEETISAMLL